ncbi:hypothetical protein I6N96_13275 [Enterococcus sp. BWM-S5]|uniref:Gram-positive cocci surface proteins LPxTG domain-containing protein n=1 Tax=Enterococcus larvae TaxID=2794352 RepID=A0ABS4CLB0_9ENTE|nr:hypothetical protein [Enterococcus larvae]MBP1047248.1 hypothetical protein [Enterococcus larvae]
MTLLKKTICFLLFFSGITLTLLSSPSAQATVTNGNIHYYEGSSTEDSSSSQSEDSQSSSVEESEVVIQQQTPTPNEPIVKDGTGGSFLKTNDTVNYLFVVVGAVFVLIAVYNLKKV